MKRSMRSESGATLVEMAMIFPVLILLIMGTIDMGLYMAARSSVNTATREAARYGSSVGLNAEALERYLDCDGIIAAAVGFGAAADLSASNFSVSYDHGPGTSVFGTCPSGGSAPDKVNFAPGDRVIVEVSKDFSMLSPMIDSFFGVLKIESIDRKTLLSL